MILKIKDSLRFILIGLSFLNLITISTINANPNSKIDAEFVTLFYEFVDLSKNSNKGWSYYVTEFAKKIKEDPKFESEEKLKEFHKTLLSLIACKDVKKIGKELSKFASSMPKEIDDKITNSNLFKIKVKKALESRLKIG